MIAIKLKQLKPDPVSRGQMRDAQTPPAGAENVRAHLPDVAVILGDLSRLHDGIEPKDFGIKLHGSVDVWNG
jgi:hypothetical protein